MSATFLSRLHISQIRNLQQVQLDGLNRINVFYGPNGSGKTSVLEAVHMLAMARSFRGSTKSLITHGESQTTVFGFLAQKGSTNGIPIGVRRALVGDVQIKVAGEPVRTIAELVQHIPVQVINADSFDLLTGSPAARRQYLDWGVFHVEHRFFDQWQRFQRAIKQRNNLLRRGKITDQELAVWTNDIARTGEALTEHRKSYFEQLKTRFKVIMEQLSSDLGDVELRFRQGWDKQLSYKQALINSEKSDREQCYTHVGPQRADIKVLVNGYSAAETMSRGQQKLTVCGLKLAQGQLMTELGKGKCTYLVDDLPSELDEQHAKLVCQLLSSMDTQVFITCVEQNDIATVWPESGIGELAMFHVEHGSISSSS